ncbi:MAG: hypothetical protein IJ491_09810 [Clostridia bacterium]|nr:hypothetical protein [Clostridia bacterium]
MGENINTQPIESETSPIGEQQIKEARQRFKRYKDSKADLNKRLKENEKFWKMKHLEGKGDGESHRPTGWLLNAIHSKHADMMDGFPEPSIRAQEEGDVKEAKILSEIVPVILRASGFKQAYDEVCSDKICKGTGVYGVYWDPTKKFGKGDISIENVNLLNLYFEPEVKDIQKSREVFLLEERDTEQLISMYPDKLKGKQLSVSETDFERYENDESVEHTDKCVVFDWYYKKWQNGREVLHYCKFVEDVVLYASENDTERPQAPRFDPVTSEPLLDEFGQPIMEEIDRSIAEKGWYEDGNFPFVFDVMFRVEGSPCGYGYIDLFGGTQKNIDDVKHALRKVANIYANPKWFYNKSSGINLQDLTNSDKQFVPVEGALDIKQFEPPQMPETVFQFLMNEIEELKEVTGNRDVNNGSTSSGVTAASGIAALQESAGKLSRHNLTNTYDRIGSLTYMVIERVRQFYNADRQFRIVGTDGREQFLHYTNANIKPQSLGNDFGNDFGYRLPQFDIIVTAAKATGYSKLSQNEFAIQLYTVGAFNPQNADVVLPMLQLMDFDDKDKVIQNVQKNATLFKQNQMLAQMALGLAKKYDPVMVNQIMMMLQGQRGTPTMQGNVDTEITKTNADGSLDGGEHAVVEKARAQSQQSTQPR